MVDRDLMEEMVNYVVRTEIVEVYDKLEDLCNRISGNPDLSAELERAKSAMWSARMVVENR